MRFRTVGVSCDAEYAKDYRGDPCGDELTLYGGATFADVDRAADREGWARIGSGHRAIYLCPKHRDAGRIGRDFDV